MACPSRAPSDQVNRNLLSTSIGPIASFDGEPAFPLAENALVYADGARMLQTGDLILHLQLATF
jgi:hypothetical protein